MSSEAEEHLASLTQRFRSDRLHHGLLFRGNNLLFLEKSAQLLTREILNIDQDASGHADLFHLRPTGKARIITVEKTRELLNNLYRSGHQGSKKVAIIHEVDRMRKEAANAFLKTLEEPPPGTFLFLLTTRPYSILPTIRSRTLMVRMEEKSDTGQGDALKEWKKTYSKWVELLLDRQRLKKDRISPVFMAYGLVESLTGLIKATSDISAKEALSNLPQELDEKEKDAYESGIRRGIRFGMLKEISDFTRHLIIQNKQIIENLNRNGIKLSRVIKQLEKITGLLEVNLKEDSALEDFFLSSLRIWSAK